MDNVKKDHSKILPAVDGKLIFIYKFIQTYLYRVKRFLASLAILHNNVPCFITCMCVIHGNMRNTLRTIAKFCQLWTVSSYLFINLFKHIYTG